MVLPAAVCLGRCQYARAALRGLCRLRTVALSPGCAGALGSRRTAASHARPPSAAARNASLCLDSWDLRSALQKLSGRPDVTDESCLPYSDVTSDSPLCQYRCGAARWAERARSCVPLFVDGMRAHCMRPACMGPAAVVLGYLTATIVPPALKRARPPPIAWRAPACRCRKTFPDLKGGAFHYRQVKGSADAQVTTYYVRSGCA